MEPEFLMVHRMKNGDEQAVEEFVRRYYPHILRYCYLHSLDLGEAEDLTQETFARFFRSLDRYQHGGKLRSYLYTIAANLCRDHQRKRKALPLEAGAEGFVEPMEQVEEALDIRKALARLPEELRTVVILSYFQGCKKKEIAQILGIGESLVRYRLNRALVEMRKLLEEEDVS